MKIALIGTNRAAEAFVRAVFSKRVSFNIEIVIIPSRLIHSQNLDETCDFEQELYKFQSLLAQSTSSKQIEFAKDNFSIEQLSNFDEIVFCTIPWSDSLEMPELAKQCKQIFDLDSITDIQHFSNSIDLDSKIIIDSGSEESIELGLSLRSKGHKVSLYHETAQQILSYGGPDNNFTNLFIQYLSSQGIEFRSGPDDIFCFDLGIWNLSKGSYSSILDYLGISYDKGIKVYPNLQSVDNDHIWALGTAGQVDGAVLGSASSLYYQASQVVNGLLEKCDKDKRPVSLRISYNSLEVLAFGSFKENLDVFYYLDSYMYSYKAIQVENGQLVAGIFLGVDKQVLYLVELWQKSSYFIDNPMFMIAPLPSPTPATSPLNMPATTLVCQCNLVTKSDIVSVAQEVDTFEKLQQFTKVSMGCGGCLSLASSIFEWVSTLEGAPLVGCAE